MKSKDTIVYLSVFNVFTGFLLNKTLEYSHRPNWLLLINLVFFISSLGYPCYWACLYFSFKQLLDLPKFVPPCLSQYLPKNGVATKRKSIGETISGGKSDSISASQTNDVQSSGHSKMSKLQGVEVNPEEVEDMKP